MDDFVFLSAAGKTQNDECSISSGLRPICKRKGEHTLSIGAASVSEGSKIKAHACFKAELSRARFPGPMQQ